MKELSIEEKAKRYDEVVAMAQECITHIPDKAVNKYMLNMFPELKEPEDERIKREIIEYIKNGTYTYHKDWIAWLEKQGEQKPIDKIKPKKFKVGDFIANDYCKGKIVELTNDAYLLDTGQGIPFSCEHNIHLWTIKDAKDGDVLHSPSHRLIWIYKNCGQYYACVNMNYTTECIKTNGLISIPKDVCPATKDERTILFERMKEAGYERSDKKN